MVLCSWQVGLLILVVRATLIASTDLLQVPVHWWQEKWQLHDDGDEWGIQRILQGEEAQS